MEEKIIIETEKVQQVEPAIIATNPVEKPVEKTVDIQALVDKVENLQKSLREQELIISNQQNSVTPEPVDISPEEKVIRESTTDEGLRQSMRNIIKHVDDQLEMGQAFVEISYD